MYKVFLNQSMLLPKRYVVIGLFVSYVLSALKAFLLVGLHSVHCSTISTDQYMVCSYFEEFVIVTFLFQAVESISFTFLLYGCNNLTTLPCLFLNAQLLLPYYH